MKESYKLLHDGMLAFARAERQGMRVDLDQAQTNTEELTDMIEELEQGIKRTKFYKHWKHSSRGGINMASNQQVANFLYNVKKIKPVHKTKSGKGGTSEEALEALNIPELTDMLRVRKLKKIRDTYLQSFLREAHNGYIHPFFNLHNVQTYRSSSDSPNWQNIPVRDKEAKKFIRQCLFPRPGHQLAELDYSGVEVRVACCYHKDPAMVRYIKDKTTDMHGDMAKQIYVIKDFDKSKEPYAILRSGAKNGFVFPQFYGDYYANNALSLAKWGGLPIDHSWGKNDGLILPDGSSLGTHMKEAGFKNIGSFTNHLKRIEAHFWKKRFPVYNAWKEKWWEDYQRKGYFDLLTGFRCSGVMERNSAINYPVQGAAFHCLLWSFIKLDKIMRKCKWKSRLIGQVHDSIIFDIYPPEKEEVLQTAKEVTTKLLPKAWKWITVPLDIEAEICEVDQSWFFKEEIKI
jgi:DNA polymerase-1